MRLRDIIPPHEPRDHDKLASLIAAYNDGAEVPPIVVIDWTGSDHDGHPPSAISGSHRLAAICAVYDDEQDARHFDEIEVIDGADLLDDLDGLWTEHGGDESEEEATIDRATRALDSLCDPFASTDFGQLCADLCALGVLPKEAVAALADQQGEA